MGQQTDGNVAESRDAQKHSVWSWLPMLLAVGLPIAAVLRFGGQGSETEGFSVGDFPAGIALHPSGDAAVTPYDPVESGSCSIRLTLLDRSSAKPLSSSIYLWRLNAPENQVWTEGDQCQVRRDVSKEGETIEELTAGWYRAQVLGTSCRAQDPSAFLVEETTDGTPQEIALHVSRPTLRRAYALIFDREGNEIVEAPKPRPAKNHGHRWRPPRLRSEWKPLVHPSWISARVPKDQDHVAGFQLRSRHGGRLYGFRDDGERVRADDPRGFDLGRYRESTLYSPPPPPTRCLAPDERAHVVVTIDVRDASSWEFCGLAIERAFLLESIRLPNGSTGVVISDSVDIASKAILSASAGDGWTDHIVTVVTVDHPDYEPLQFGYRRIEGDPPTRTLRRR